MTIISITEKCNILLTVLTIVLIFSKFVVLTFV